MLLQFPKCIMMMRLLCVQWGVKIKSVRKNFPNKQISCTAHANIADRREIDMFFVMFESIQCALRLSSFVGEQQELTKKNCTWADICKMKYRTCKFQKLSLLAQLSIRAVQRIYCQTCADMCRRYFCALLRLRILASIQ